MTQFKRVGVYSLSFAVGIAAYIVAIWVGAYVYAEVLPQSPHYRVARVATVLVIAVPLLIWVPLLVLDWAIDRLTGLSESADQKIRRLEHENNRLRLELGSRK